MPDPDKMILWLTLTILVGYVCPGELTGRASNGEALFARDGSTPAFTSALTQREVDMPIRKYVVVPPMEGVLEDLREISANLWFSWNPEAVELFVHLAEGLWEAGSHELSWTARDGKGRDLPSGIYFLRLRTEALTLTQKLVLLR